ncbi:M67 family metallopeptidase [Acetonema longum]|uniref:Mov34/mpn/pad-1 family protein n=1 Tax=Acetonema longum DSM 6540 TaxID=1009370 RepID=F7NHD4_9FIRM|nr:M67 family metallopeptidase [Acetonema longum]EGO64617.1 mov34/mpn/pad-1 family protein [Acetonema longum DSM 6540]
MLILSQRHYDKIVTHCLNGLPNEACGLLGGIIAGAQKTVQEIYPLTNLDHSPEHFAMDPKEQFQAVKAMRTNGWVLLGNFHSHPSTPARPSEEDKRLAFDPGASYLIVSLAEQGNPVLKSFNIQNGVAAEEKITLNGEEQ